MWCESHLLSVSVRNSCLKTAISSCRRPGAPAVGDMWGLYLFFLSGVGGGKGEGGERSGEEEKSNNPNLKGGEKHTVGIVGIKKSKNKK